NHIQEEITESRYKVRDLGIQVAVDNVKNNPSNEVEYLSLQEQNTVEDGINSILNSIITTCVNAEYGEIEPKEKTSIVFKEFNGNTPFSDKTSPVIPLWMYITGAILLVIIIILIIFLIRTRKDSEEDIEADFEYEPTVAAETKIEVPQIDEQPETESVIRKKQL